MSKLAAVLSVCAAVTVGGSSVAFARWAHERDGDLGFRFTYPTELFQSIEGDRKPSFHYFASRDERAKFMVGAWNNEAGQSPS
jgi:hypothetical protein